MNEQELYFAFLRRCKELCGMTEDGWDCTVEKDTARKEWLLLLEFLSVKEVTKKTTGGKRYWRETKKNTGTNRSTMTEKPAKDKDFVICRDPWRGFFEIGKDGFRYGLKVPKELALKILTFGYVGSHK